MKFQKQWPFTGAKRDIDCKVINSGLEGLPTASPDAKVLEQLKNSGIKEIFKKPFSSERLTELIKYRPTA